VALQPSREFKLEQNHAHDRGRTSGQSNEIVDRHGRRSEQFDDARALAGVRLGARRRRFRLLGPKFKFDKYGQCGAELTDLLPHLAECVDDITFIHSMQAKSSNHTPATFQMNSGFTSNGFPCLGAWLSYGLGRREEETR